MLLSDSAIERADLEISVLAFVAGSEGEEEWNDKAIVSF